MAKIRHIRSTRYPMLLESEVRKISKDIYDSFAMSTNGTIDRNRVEEVTKSRLETAQQDAIKNERKFCITCGMFLELHEHRNEICTQCMLDAYASSNF